MPRTSWRSDTRPRRQRWSRSTRPSAGPGRSSNGFSRAQFQPGEKVNVYTILKFVHVLSVITWIGGLTGLSVATWRATKEQNRALYAAVLRQTIGYGGTVVGAASGLVLLTGLTMVGIGHVGFGTFWVWFGYG